MTGLFRKLILLVTLTGMVVASAAASAAGLREQFLGLSHAHGFEIQGLGLIGDERDRLVSGELRHQISRLLSRYNYVVVDDETGGIAKLIILAVGEAGVLPEAEIGNINIASPPGTHVIPARRRGSHQVVEAVLVGPGQAPVAALLMVDTGASTIVLPASMIQVLGFAIEELRNGWTQTANGRVRAKIGKLASVDVGTAVAEDVKVTFLDDHRLGGSKLLGMSFLQRFRMTIDDANNRIILSAE